MSPEAQRIALAKAHGYNLSEPYIGDGSYLPDYLNDLNAMHEAEVALTEEQAEKYEAYLNSPGMYIEGGYPSTLYLYHATAAQRAEAFLKTLGLWKD